MKYKIVLVPFPFDDFTTSKVRPALCLTDSISVYNHIVICFITSQLNKADEVSDLPILSSDSSFKRTGLKVDSAVRLHRMVTIPKTMILRELGNLPEPFHQELRQKLSRIFELN